MSAGLSITAVDYVTPQLTVFIRGLEDKAPLHAAIGRRAQNVVRDHLIGLAQSRHETADRLGATPSGHLRQAAEKTTMAADADGATVSVNQPGMARATRDVTIKPGPGRKAIAIPLIAAAYNQRAYAIWGEAKLFVVRSESGKAFAAQRTPGGGLVFWYALVPSVTQKQDRSLLPSDAELGQAALVGTLDYVRILRSQATGGLH